LIDSVVGGRIFDTLERKFARTFPRRILCVFSTVIKFGLTSASIAGSRRPYELTRITEN
jgi:hypothetical protein